MKPKATYGTLAVLALVMLRIATGWHFYSEGAKKLRDPNFSSVAFLRQAKGPLAEFFRAKVPAFHNWTVIADPAAVPGEGWQGDLDAWLSRYNSWRKSIETNEPKKLEYSPDTAFGPWAKQIVADWRESVSNIKQQPGWKDQQEAVDALLLNAEVALADYFAGSGEEFQAYAADRVRLAKWKQAPTTGELPFHDERIVVKRSELNAVARGWAQTIGSIEQNLIEDLTELLPADSRNIQQQVAAEAFESDTARELRQVDKIVTWWVLGIGVFLVIGLFTPLAAIGGVAFLLSVIATQPPWVADADTTYFYYQLVEIFALLVLATTWSGRWVGLDFFFARMFAREGISN